MGTKNRTNFYIYGSYTVMVLVLFGFVMILQIIGSETNLTTTELRITENGEPNRFTYSVFYMIFISILFGFDEYFANPLRTW